jgi:glycine hydroxymethyltransferase
VAAKAVALKEAMQPSFAEYARQVVANARALAAALAANGMRPVSGGTDTHLALIDLRSHKVTGREAEERCDAARITLNKNAIPYDPQKPMIASGVRVGTPSVTTQGMREPEMREIAGLIARAVVSDPETPGGRVALAEVASCSGWGSARLPVGARRRPGSRSASAWSRAALPRPALSSRGPIR